MNRFPFEEVELNLKFRENISLIVIFAVLIFNPEFPADSGFLFY